jgi:hypothetical protein
VRSDLWAFWKFSTAPLLPLRIIPDFSEIFTEFRGKQISLLWQGSRDGFKAQEFHRRCDGHANTLTVILDMEGNIFGGFTPVEWDSVSNYKADDNRRNSFHAEECTRHPGEEICIER